MRRTLTAAAAAILACLGTSTAQDGGEKGLYFPVKEGTQRAYVKSRDGSALEGYTDAVTKVEKRGDAYLVSVTQESAGKTTTAVLEVSPRGIVRVMTGERKEDPPVTLLKLPAKAGESWKATLPGKGDGVKVTYTTLTEEEVEVPAGRFKAVAVVMEHESAPGQVQKGTLWYASGAGIVKSVFGGARSGLVTELKSIGWVKTYDKR